jgi:hypothetical protein
MKRLALTLLVAGCSAAPRDLGPAADDPIWSKSGKDDSSASGVVRAIDWDAFVLVPAGSDDASAAGVVRAQVRSALGALWHGPHVSLRDRDARSNLDPSTFHREAVQVVGPDGSGDGALDRVRYHYHDLALLPAASTASALPVPLLFGDYAAPADDFAAACGDGEAADPGSFWYHYDPSRAACQSAITDENQQIDAATAGLGPGQIARADAHRRFLTVAASLGPAQPMPDTAPEYDRLFGFGTDKAKVTAYSFFGVANDATDVHDPGLVESLRLVRTLRAQIPQLAVVDTRPFVMLLDFSVGGAPLGAVAYEDVARWVIDGAGWPDVVGDDAAKQAELLAQVRDKWLERWIVWQVPVLVARGGESRAMTVEIRTYYGREDGQPDWRQQAQWRYLEAFWYGDVFAYSGHSHFGNGPLEPFDYSPGNFPDRYQVMLFNSCLSYNYYDVDFLQMHRGNLNVVSNGLPAYWDGMGESTARYLIGLLGGGNRTWRALLSSMVVDDVPSVGAGYEPMRIVTGDGDNHFQPARDALDWRIAN